MKYGALDTELIEAPIQPAELDAKLSFFTRGEIHQLATAVTGRAACDLQPKWLTFCLLYPPRSSNQCFNAGTNTLTWGVALHLTFRHGEPTRKYHSNGKSHTLMAYMHVWPHL